MFIKISGFFEDLLFHLFFPFYFLKFCHKINHHWKYLFLFTFSFFSPIEHCYHLQKYWLWSNLNIFTKLINFTKISFKAFLFEFEVFLPIHILFFTCSIIHLISPQFHRKFGIFLHIGQFFIMLCGLILVVFLTRQARWEIIVNFWMHKLHFNRQYPMKYLNHFGLYFDRYSFSNLKTF